MRLISAIAILLLVSSCAHNRIRLVKASPRQIVNVEQKTSRSESDNVAEELSEVNYDIAEVSGNQNTNFVDPTPYYSTQLLQPQDSTASETPKLSQEEFDSALRSERNAKNAKNSFIASFPALLIPGLGIILSLVFFVVGEVFYSHAKRSRYTTEEGQYQEEKARKWRLAYAVLMGISFLLAATVVILLLVL